MRFFQHLLAVVSLSLVTITATASLDKPKNGVDYRTLQQPQQTESGNKVEVTEFFWYGCPHCRTLDPVLEDWVKKQGNKISFKRVPVAFRDSFVPLQKLYYSLEAMNKLEEIHPKIFHAIHVERKNLDTDAGVMDFVTAQGIDKEKFAQLYNSFSMQSKVRRAAQMQAAYEVDGVPLIAIDGRYLTSPAIVGASLGRKPEPVLHAATLQVMDALVNKAAKERGAQSSNGGKPAK